MKRKFANYDHRDVSLFAVQGSKDSFDLIRVEGSDSLSHSSAHRFGAIASPIGLPYILVAGGLGYVTPVKLQTFFEKSLNSHFIPSLMLKQNKTNNKTNNHNQI